VRGFGFIQRVPRDALADFVAAERADGAPRFAVRQLTLFEQPDLFVIKFIEPAARNEGALGLDVGSEAVRREAVQQALLTGEPTLTGTVILLQDERRSPGVLLLVPVFGQRPAAVRDDAVHGALRGLLYAPIVISELLEGLVDVAAGQMRIELFDTASGTVAGPLMFDSQAESAAVAAPTSGMAEEAAAFDAPAATKPCTCSRCPAAW